MEEAIKDNRIWFGKDGNGVPRIKTYLNTKDRGLTPETILFAKDCSTNEKAKNDLKELFNSCAVFETPKPVELIAYLLNMVLGKSDIALDFFSGSAATADAVMQLNRSDFGDRSYMCVQIPEATKEDSEAYANGYKTIDQIGIERIKRAADKIKRESPLFHGDLGFKHYTLKEPSAKALEQMEAFDPHVVLATNTLAEEFGNATILTTWMVRDGYTLTPEMLVVDLCGYEAYHCDKHLYLIHTGLSTDAIDALVTKYEKEVAFNPINVVVYGYAFTWSELQALKDNLRRLSVTDKNIRVNIDIRY
jgi:type III restriction enzyme/adenine-specific DNA-methyltransferase